PDLTVVEGPDIDAAIAKAIETAGGIGKFISRGDVVVIKPNMAWDRTPEQAANTNPQVVASVVKLCFEAGAKTVKVLDNPVEDARRVYVQSGIAQAAKELGAQTPYMDDRKFRKMKLNGEALKEWEVYQEIVEADKVINIPITKHHTLAGLTMSMKNWMGAIGGGRSRIHWKLDESLADLAAFFKPTLTILDSSRILTANGPQGGSLSYVKVLNTVVVGTDQVAIDAFGASLFEREAERPESAERARRYIKLAAKRGAGRMDLENLKIVKVNLS
ncbi:MAG: DUF362 domain-containing protein, partial [Proteobacteria bacterium]|nr:DUF362 domain-containing protein [Pseudomonadota bacterium]NIS68612.1 DUF362 domain-containing protein [Pseudomonadota bacterium]